MSIVRLLFPLLLIFQPFSIIISNKSINFNEFKKLEIKLYESINFIYTIFTNFQNFNYTHFDK